MCGISGIINFHNKAVQEQELYAMMKLMKHRGPDDDGIYIDANTGFGFVRLSIIDLSSDGHQPMISEDGNYAVVFNGEIYNYIELRKELETDFRFRTKTDTEVILKSYLKWGKECLHKFNGMFAIAIYNKKENEVFIARDRYGVKPLYYYYDSNNFTFCSEIPPILKATNKFYTPEANNQIIYDFLVYNRTNHTENTFFNNILKLQHGHFITIKKGKTKIERWYNLESRINRNQKISKDEFLQAIFDSVELRLRSDVPLGACLSGGIDSSTIVSAIHSHFKKNDLNTFSAIYKKGETGDESDFINAYSGQLKNMHFIRPDAESFLCDMDDFVSTMQEPVPGTSAYAEYKVYQLAKNFTTVILNGQGADEELGGYIYFSGFYYKELFYQLRYAKMIREMWLDKKNHGIYEGHLSFLYFMLPAGIKDSVSSSISGFLTPDFKSKYKGDVSFLEKLYGSSTLNRALINHFEYKFEHHLIWGDRSSMRFSLESRYPFLDYHLVEKALALKNEQVISNGVTKKILRDAVRGLIPESIRMRQDKTGYETPEDNWFRQKELKDFAFDILRSKSFLHRGYVDAGKALNLFSQHQSGKVNRSADIWKWVHLELWFRKFIDKD